MRPAGVRPRAVAPTLVAIVLSAVFGLAGCASLAPSPAPAASAAREAEAPQAFSGRLALTVSAPEPGQPAPAPATRSASGLFELVGTASTGRLTLTSPLGATLAEARWTPREARLVAPEGERRYGSLDALTADLVGEPLPIGALFAWLGGHPAGGAASRLLKDGAGFEQLGWRVELGRFSEGRLRLARDGELRVELRLVLDAATPP